MARRRLSRDAVLVAVSVALVLASGCGGSDRDALTAAQRGVSSAQEALAEAQSAAAAAEGEFCDSAGQYVVALDRYGDVLNQTAPTVGDVVDAGADLAEPREQTRTAADAVSSTREAVTLAEKDLADAQAQLAVAEAEAGGSTPPAVPPTSTAEPSPSVPPATLARVQQAESEFTEAQQGITGSTPLVQAGEQFNAAAVALEMAWLSALAQSRCLTDDQKQQAATAVRDYTAALQQDLSSAGYYSGAIDGVYGPETVAAVQALQSANGLPQTGTVDKATEAALRSELTAVGGLAAQEAMVSTAALQQTLKLCGYWNGPVDGQWTDELTAALQELQTDLGVPVTGTVDAATISAFQRAIAQKQEAASPSPAPSAAPPPSASDEPMP